MRGQRPSFSSIFRLYARLSSASRAGIVLVTTLSIAGRLVVLLTALAVGESNVERATLFGIVAVAVYGGQRLTQSLIRARVERDLYHQAVESLLRADALEIAAERSQRVVLEGVYFGMQLAQSMPQLIADLVAVVIILPVLATFTTRILSTAAITLFAIGVAALLARRISQRAEAAANEAYEGLANALVVALEARVEIVAAGGDDRFGERFRSLTARYVTQADRAGAAGSLLGRAPLLLGLAVVGAVALLDPSVRQEISVAVVTKAVVFAACLPPVLSAVMGLQGAGRAVALLAPFLQLTEGRVRDDGIGGAQPKLPAKIEMEDVSFRYGSEDPLACEKLSISWDEERPLVLEGENGSGKSTVLRLLAGLRIPTGGRITIGGYDLTQIDRRAFRQRVAYLPQRPYLGESHASIRSAFHIHAPEASDDEIAGALERVGLLKALRGQDVLSEQVGTLSSGQRQRLALARLLLRDANVLILDEPDANLDPEGLALVLDLLHEEKSKKKLIAIAIHSTALASIGQTTVKLTRRRDEAD